MKLLSKNLVSHDYRDQLQKDLDRTSVCRFLVAYISSDGLENIGRDRLTRVLRAERSFGVSSLSCSCGHEPLLHLQSKLGEATVRLKYFMDPLVIKSDEPSNMTLFHSKMVYLALERDKKSVVYIGSHNWTRRTLGPGKPRNAEASLRLEMDFSPEHLDGTGPSIMSEVNRHLRQAYDLPACLPATTANETAFRQWHNKGCKSASAIRLEEVVVLLAVNKHQGQPPYPLQWQQLSGHGIYLQVLEETEGDTLWRINDRVFVLVWSSEANLRGARQPIILRCRVTTNKAGLDSKRHGTNLSADPITGFQGVLFDAVQLAAMQNSSRPRRSSLSIWSGSSVEDFHFEFPTSRTNSSQVDGGVTPMYQFHLEVEHIAFPEAGDHPESPDMVWGPESFAVVRSRKDVKHEEIPGYAVTVEQEAAIRRCLAETLLIDPENAKVLPVSSYDRARVGKGVSAHPLHDTFLGAVRQQPRIAFYERTGSEALVADFDEVEARGRADQPASVGEPVQRVQRVLTTPWRVLEALWTARASQLRPRKPEGGPS